MNYDEIMKSITQGLTGDFDTDRQYLMNQMENYKDHDLGKEIVRACGRLLYSILPEDKKEEIARVMQTDELGVEATLDEVRFNIYKKDYEKADVLMKALVTKVEDLEKKELHLRIWLPITVCAISDAGQYHILFKNAEEFNRSMNKEFY